MKEPKGTDIRARIDFDLKQEFNDIFSDMSKKIIEMIKDSINTEKEKYLKALSELCRSNSEYIDILENVIDYK